MPPSEISVVRLVKIPDAAPPYDCETHGTGCTARDVVEPDPRADRPGSAGLLGAPSQADSHARDAGSRAGRAEHGALATADPRALASAGPGALPAGARGALPAGARGALAAGARGALAAAAAGASSAVAPGTPAFGAGTTAVLPRQFAQVIVEILAGVRSPGQIVPWTTDRARAQMRCLAPLLASDRRPRIQRIVMSRPTACAVEMTVIVSLGPRSRALALRLEHMAARPAVPGVPARPARWLCTEIEAGLPGEAARRPGASADLRGSA